MKNKSDTFCTMERKCADAKAERQTKWAERCGGLGWGEPMRGRTIRVIGGRTMNKPMKGSIVTMKERIYIETFEKQSGRFGSFFR
jgi:hypothetical protein